MMTKLPQNIKYLNLTNEEYEKLSLSDKMRINKELPCNDQVCYSESYPNGNYDLTKLPCVINGVLVY